MEVGGYEKVLGVMLFDGNLLLGLWIADWVAGYGGMGVHSLRGYHVRLLADVFILCYW